MHFLSKFVSRPLIQPASHSPSSDLYYLAFPKDPLTTKILVYAVYAIELTQTILLSKMAFRELAAGFGKFEALNEAGNFWFSVPILSSSGVFHSIHFWPPFIRLLTSKSVGFIVQLFYAYKIKLLARSNLIAMVVILVNVSFYYCIHFSYLLIPMSQFALVQLGGGIAQGTIGHQLPLFSEFLNRRTSIANGVRAVAQVSLPQI